MLISRMIGKSIEIPHWYLRGNMRNIFMIILLYIMLPIKKLKAKANKKNLIRRRKDLFLLHFKSNWNQIAVYPVIRVIEKNKIPQYFVFKFCKYYTYIVYSNLIQVIIVMIFDKQVYNNEMSIEMNIKITPFASVYFSLLKLIYFSTVSNFYFAICHVCNIVCKWVSVCVRVCVCVCVCISS